MNWKRFNKNVSLTVTSSLLLFSCQPKIVRPPAPVPPTAPKLLEHTFGSLRLETSSGTSIVYKSISLKVNALPSASTPVDYLLLQGGTVPNLAGLRTTQKIIAPATVADSLKRQGFSYVKDLPDGRMIQLTKESAFLFVLAAEAKISTGATVKSYLLEFDNGRNVLLLADGVRADDLRPFLYSLRDEGKQIDLALVPPSSPETAAEIIGLFQPQEAAVTGLSSGSNSDLLTKLKDQFFQGALIFPKPGETIDF